LGFFHQKLGAQATFLGAQIKFSVVNPGGGGEVREVEEDGGGLIVEILGRGPGAEIFHETLLWSNINQIL